MCVWGVPFCNFFLSYFVAHIPSPSIFVVVDLIFVVVDVVDLTPFYCTLSLVKNVLSRKDLYCV